MWFQISPDKLRQFGVTVHRIVQKAGQFIILFPQSFVASVACGYNVSESIKFATADWLPFGYKAAQVIIAVFFIRCTTMFMPYQRNGKLFYA